MMFSCNLNSIPAITSSHDKIKIRNEWISIIRRCNNDKKWTPTKQDKVCSLHFAEDDLYSNNNRKFCKRRAVPTLHIHKDVPSSNPEEPNRKSLVNHGQQNGSSNFQIQTTKRKCVKYLSRVSSNFPENVFGVAGQMFIAINEAYCTPSIQKSLRVDLGLDDDQVDVLSVVVRKHFTRRAPKRTTKGESENGTSSYKRQKTETFFSPSRLHQNVDHLYSCKLSPMSNTRRLQGRIKSLQKLNNDKTKKIKQRKLAQTKLNSVIKKCEKNESSTIVDTIRQFKPSPTTILESEMKKKKLKSIHGMRYSDDMKKIAVTLHYYSPKTYRYIRQHLFQLPHENSLSKWMRGCKSGPGFNSDVVKRMQSALQIGEIKSNDVNFIFDEMAIRKETVWCPSRNRFLGHIDYGIEMPEGDLPLATNVLVGLMVGLTGSWKVPIGYIFTDHIGSEGLFNFMQEAIRLISSHGFTLHTIIADGCPSNVKLFSMLGILEDVKNNRFINSFTNPYDSASPPIHVAYDICHMFKLIRNLFCHYKNVYNEDGFQISYNYIELLLSLQEGEFIRAGNKLRKEHQEWESHKMKVRLAVQVLSRSVADAIVFLRDDLQLPQFQGSKATTDFIRMIDHVFDILNSRCNGQLGSKATLSLVNIVEKKQFLEESTEKLLSYKIITPRGRVMLLCETKRKRAVLGFYLSSRSIISVAFNILSRSETPLKYVMTYRFSQDLLELLFTKFRNRLGANNNPNVLEMERIIKKTWHTSLLRPLKGNCLSLDEDVVIYNGFLPLKRTSKMLANKDDVIITINNFLESDLSDFRTEFYSNCLGYIAGNVVYKISKKLKCGVCKTLLFESEDDHVPCNDMLLTKRKNRGGLTVPSGSVLKIIKLADKYFRASVSGFKIVPTTKYMDAIIIYYVLMDCQGLNLFPKIGDHVIDFDFLMQESHSTQLVRMIVNQFLRIRLFDLGKRLRKDILSLSLRSSTGHKTKYRHE